MKSLVTRRTAGVLAALVAATATVVVASPAQAAGRVSVDADGRGAVIDRTYSTTLTVTGSGFQSIQGGHGGVYVWFGTVNGTWRPSKGGRSGVNYVYVPDSETKDNAGFQRYVAFPGSNTASAANGGTMDARGRWSTQLVVPGPKFEAVGRNGKVTTVDCRKVTCGVITIGAHGVSNGNNETFTPVRLADLGASTGSGTGGSGSGGTSATGGTGVPAARTTEAPTEAPATVQAVPSGPPALTVDHASAVAGRAMSFRAENLVPGEQFTLVLDDGLAAVGPFLVGEDGSASGVLGLPADLDAGTHEVRVFGSSKEATLKFGVQSEVDESAADDSEGPQEWERWFVLAAVVVFLLALALSVARFVRGRRAAR